MESLLKILIVTSSLGLSAQTYCMNPEQIEAVAYWHACSTINKTNKEKLNKLLHCAASTNPTEQISFIEDKLKLLKKKINAQREDALIMLKNKYHISDDNWNARLNVAQQLYDSEETHQHIAIPGAKHDENMPADILLMLQKNLINNGINPKRFTLKLSKKKGTKSILPYVDNFTFNGVTFNVQSKKPGKLRINPQILELPLSLVEKEGLCFSLIHAISKTTRYGIGILTALTLLDKYCDKKDQLCLKTKDVIVFRNNYAALSLLIAALTNEHNATITKAYYKSNYIPDEFSIKNYKLLCKINRLHQALAWLKRYTIFNELPQDSEINTQEQLDTAKLLEETSF